MLNPCIFRPSFLSYDDEMFLSLQCVDVVVNIDFKVLREFSKPFFLKYYFEFVAFKLLQFSNRHVSSFKPKKIPPRYCSLQNVFRLNRYFPDFLTVIISVSNSLTGINIINILGKSSQTLRLFAKKRATNININQY